MVVLYAVSLLGTMVSGACSMRVAQEVQPILQPTCDETHSVVYSLFVLPPPLLLLLLRLLLPRLPLLSGGRGGCAPSPRRRVEQHFRGSAVLAQ